MFACKIVPMAPTTPYRNNWQTETQRLFRQMGSTERVSRDGGADPAAARPRKVGAISNLGF
jgi:hypothetical protein